MTIIEMLDFTANAEELIELAILNCTNEWEDICDDVMVKKSRRDRIKYIMSRGHHSVLEHAKATFIFRDWSLAANQQLIRHRMASYSQMSMRYVDASGFTFKLPPDIAIDYDLTVAYLEHYENGLKLYKRAIATEIEDEDGSFRKIKKEDARFILPVATTTNIIVTMNLRGWMHFLKERLYPGAQWEIREAGKQILEQLIWVAPNVFDPELRKFWL